MSYLKDEIKALEKAHADLTVFDYLWQSAVAVRHARGPHVVVAPVVHAGAPALAVYGLDDNPARGAVLRLMGAGVPVIDRPIRRPTRAELDEFMSQARASLAAGATTALPPRRRP